MGQGQSKKPSKVAIKSKNEYFHDMYSLAAKKVEKDIPRLRAIYDNIMKPKHCSDQAVVFYKYLY